MQEDRLRIGTRVTLLTLGANSLLAVLKLTAGLLGNSSAMIADSLHSFSDSISTIAVLVGLRISGRPPDEEHHYGHARAEAVAAKIVALFLIFIAGGVGLSSVRALSAREYTIPSGIALGAALVSIVAKELMFRYAFRTGKQIRSNALIADAWHHRTDALSSVTAFLGIGGARLGLPLLDPLAGLMVAFMVFFTGLKLYWESIQELVDTAPSKEITDKIVRIAGETKGVLAVNEIKARCHGPRVYADLKICVNQWITVQEGHCIAHSVVEGVKEKVPEVTEILVHVNPCHQIEKKAQGEPVCERCTRKQIGDILL